jgi:uncharacterized membrane protein YkvA (DUF1232 family)
MRVSFEISSKDLRHFRECMQKALHAVRDADESDIVEAAREMFEEVNAAEAPLFVKERLRHLRAMTGMIEDEIWALPNPARGRALSALVYFCDPEDMIPDSIPGIGYLDDAIMIELVFRELRHEIEAYEDFAEYRDTYNRRFRIGRDAASRAQRLKTRRDKLFERIDRRNAKDKVAQAKGKQPAPLW